MTGSVRAAVVATTLAAASLGASSASAAPFNAMLDGYQEVPTLSTPAAGLFEARIDERAGEIHWEMTFGGFESSVLQSHLHLGQRGTNGGISVFLCTNLGNAAVQACPNEGTIEGVVRAGDVIGPADQGIAAGEFAELVDAIRAGAVYANIHTERRPSGEARGQLVHGRHGR